MNSSLFSGLTSGLTSTYSVLSSASSGKVTLSSITSAMSNSTYLASINPTFASYISSNFSTLDANHDGILSAAELMNSNNVINATGLTSAQLTQLGTATGLSTQDLQQVLSHFADIDANGDGKVTSAEIQSYKLTSAMQQKKDEFANRAASNMSIFYADDAASNSSSLLSYKYWNDGSSNNSNSSYSSGSSSVSGTSST